MTLKNMDFLKITKPKNLAIEDDVELDDSVDKTIVLKEAVGDFEKNHIQDVLSQNQWNKGKSAAILNVSRKTLFRKMKTYGLI